MTVKRNFQDSLFRDIFSFPENQLKQYMAFHPEDTTVTVDDITNVTLESILVKDMYNDLVFLVRNQLIVLFEAQSTWSPNIMVRELMYFAKTLENYIYDNRINMYSTAAAPIPRPELYLVYSGDRKDLPETLSLADTFWDGDSRFLELRVKVIVSKGDDIIGQYLKLVSSLKEAIHSEEPESALRKAIDECIGKDILTDYLKIRKKEVIDYMLKILDDEFINESIYKSVYEEGREEGREETLRVNITRLAQSYRDADISISEEQSIRMAAELLDPEHIVSIEEMISDISAQENASEKY